MPSTSPPPYLDIKIGEEAVSLKMPFGRLNELAELIQSFERLPEIDFDARTRTRVLEICLAPRDARGRLTDPEWCIPPDLDVETAKTILDWAKDHLSDFLLGRLEQHLAALKANGERLTGVGSSLSSLATSASKTP